LVIELLKHSHFLKNYLKLQILASYNNLRIGQDSEFARPFTGPKYFGLVWLFTNKKPGADRFARGTPGFFSRFHRNFLAQNLKILMIQIRIST
jgi:hypothetical protein